MSRRGNTIRGKDIRTIDPDTLHHLFGIVFQNDYLFGTARENIDFGRGLPERSILEAAGYAQADNFLNEKEEGIDFVLASKGVNLSGGEKQRLLLSRALAGEPEIIILDDSSSALDFRTDAKLRQALKDHFNKTTTIIVAQRISSIRHADKIIFLEEGHMRAIGNHEALQHMRSVPRSMTCRWVFGGMICAQAMSDRPAGFFFRIRGCRVAGERWRFIEKKDKSGNK